MVKSFWHDGSIYKKYGEFFKRFDDM